MDIGGKIKKSRTDAKITQEQAAQALGISRQTISKWENERSYPDIVSVLKMSDLYSVSLDYLLKGEGPMKDYLAVSYTHLLRDSTFPQTLSPSSAKQPATARHTGGSPAALT